MEIAWPRCANTGLGIWDVYAACEREGSLDSAIRHAELNDFEPGLRALPAIAGHRAQRWRELSPRAPHAALGLPVFRLPSTSPANASWSFERKLAAWREVFKACGLQA
jgi:hypoxanthine-DNA glycosylase